MTDYVELGSAAHARGSMFNPLKAAAGVAGLLMVSAAGWVANHISHISSDGVLNVPSPANTPGRSVSSSWPAFVPKQGAEKVLVAPGPPTQQLVPPGAARKTNKPKALFVYSGAAVPKELTLGTTSQEGWLYGAQLHTTSQGIAVGLSPLRGTKIAVPTGQTGDIIKGTIFSWPDSDSLDENIRTADRLMSYDSQKPLQGRMRRSIAPVIKEDGSEVQAYWYYQLSTPSADDDPRLAQKAKNFMRDYLIKENLLNLHRPVRVELKPYTLGFTPNNKNQKVLHLVRHGQGFHNLLNEVYREYGVTGVDSAYKPELLDAPLTALGRRQAQMLQGQTRLFSNLDLVVTSPLARAVQTALLAFQPQLEQGVPIVGHQSITEQSGLKACNKRRPLKEIAQEFPMVDWSDHSMTRSEQDPLWVETNQETARSMSDRGYEFLLWLRARPESEAALVAHCQFLFTLLNTAMTSKHPELQAWFSNGSLRSVVLEFVDSADS
eukprot:gb/GEZN01005570.1/.p1 GENE.gb/GEZN01005570.1/~~gb/GEZN01005570.1/.p1  ORF type:complete len:492 (-),score=57.27 gb/GEZN01005570.1/:242-1717(-)